MAEDAVAAIADLSGETGMVVSLLNLVSGTFSEAVPLTIPALDSMELSGESLPVALEVRMRLTSKALLPEVRLFRDIDLVELLPGTADSGVADDDKEVELALMWPPSKCWSMLLVVKSSDNELEYLSMEFV